MGAELIFTKLELTVDLNRGYVEKCCRRTHAVTYCYDLSPSDFRSV